ncbi:hypothetical protein HPB48_017886 [Haemaphysalis longicornis]|uniref:Uncharacterized protein n=1 Tax=Haemaphysalis longicornis TaxID=44386 RepID=A0A9J6GR63_HAELO|nr:hypothetical protein HPB48_017886 [Haemaphysalis longicornis]
MDAISTPSPSAALHQSFELSKAAGTASQPSETSVDHRDINTAVNTHVGAAGFAPPTAPFTMRSTEDSMEDEEKDPSEWNTVPYRRYTTKLQGELRAERVTALNTAVNNSKTEARATCIEQARFVPGRCLSKLQQQMESFIQQKFEAMQKQIMSWMQASQGHSEQPAINPVPIAKARTSAGLPPPKKPLLTSLERP